MTKEGGQTNLTMWFKREAYHAVPIMVNLWGNARMQLLGLEQSTVQVTSHPLPKSQQLVQEEMSGGEDNKGMQWKAQYIHCNI